MFTPSSLFLLPTREECAPPAGRFRAALTKSAKNHRSEELAPSCIGIGARGQGARHLSPSPEFQHRYLLQMDFFCFCISLPLAPHITPAVPLGKPPLPKQHHTGTGRVATKGSQVPRAHEARLPQHPGRVCSACHSSPGNGLYQFSATWLFDYNYHFVLYTGHESSEQLRAPSRSVLTNNE